MKLNDIISLEDETLAAVPPVKKQKEENEIVIYAKITNFDGLEQCIYKEEQEQYTIKSKCESTNTSGNVRVRKTTYQDMRVGYVLTNKVKLDSAHLKSNIEEDISITPEHYEAFRMICNEGMKKTRYVFKTNSITVDIGEGEEKKTIDVPGMVFEVDVFKNSEGINYQWCKIDLEIDKLLQVISKEEMETKIFKLNVKVKDLPFSPIDAFMEHLATPEQKVFISKLYSEVFITKQ